MVKHSAKSPQKKTRSKSPTPPGLMSPQLEADMRAFLEKRKKAGLSERAIVRQLHRRFGSAINRELQTNPVTQKRVQHHVQQKQIRNYRVWARPFVRLYLFIRSKFIK